MFEKSFRVKFVTSKNCFCYLPDKYYQLLERGNIINLQHGKESLLLTVMTTSNALKDQEIGINVTFARSLGIKEGDDVSISTVSDLPGVRSVTISPLSKDDYDILELLAESIQNTMLHQVRVVNKEKKLVIWVSNIHVVVVVEDAKPTCPGRLHGLTEVIIKPPEVKSKHKYEEAVQQANTLKTKFLNYISKKEDEKKTKNNLEKYEAHTTPLVFRLHSIEDLLTCINISTTPKIFQQPFNVFTKRQSLPESFKTANTFETPNFYTLRLIQPLVSVKDFLEEPDKEETLVVRLCILEDFCDNMDIANVSRLPSLFSTDCVFKYLGVKVGAKITLEELQAEIPRIGRVQVCPLRKFDRNCVEDFENYLGEISTSEEILFNSNVPIRVNDESRCALKFSHRFCLLRDCGVDFENGEYFREEAKSDCLGNVDLLGFRSEEFCLGCSNYEEILTDGVRTLKMGINVDVLENSLITGKTGTGKTTLTKLFASRVGTSPFHVHTEIISCKNIKGKTIESLTKIFGSTFAYLIYYQPSLLILDDLDVLCERVVDGDAPTQENLHFNRVSEWLAQLLDIHLHGNCIALLATAQSAMRLNQNIFSSRGRHLFKNVYSIKELTKEDRTTLLEHLFEQKAENREVDCESLSVKTEGFVIQDLVDFVDKSVFEQYKDHDKLLRMNHCEVALEKTSSLSLRNVQLHSPGDKDFSDVGGLENVKKILTESMLWPVQYSNLFGKAPLRLQSGMLLYGPPGTGKTILAGAAAKHCGLRLISIKGPELLSKYIGASEQAVRDVFQKAQSAKPCILFFDEFDSLAPRRGHDSTGVTDRVVNQFLTQLDGIESLNGVCVLAATSRPDLLDPALLRPGRLDKQILCPLPNKSSRLLILKALSKNMTLGKDVNLEKLASETESFSGADLQAVLYTAQLGSVSNILDGGKEIKKAERVEIRQTHLVEALKTTRPSLTKDERSKYDRIYAKFQGRSDILDIQSGKQRTTLA